VRQPLDLEQIFSRYAEAVHGFLYRRVGNREDADDLTAEVFLKASRLLDTGRSEASVRAWLFAVARSVLADHWRRYYRAGAPLSLDDLRIETVPEELEPPDATDDMARRVAELLSRLPDRYRRVLELRFLHGYTIQETAQALSITPDNVKVIQHRALARAVQVGEDMG
jgi:RNA polymerase sigma-70 factor (ECF subfamily)